MKTKNNCEELHTILEQKQVEAVFVTDPFNMRRLSGFSGGEGMLFISRDQKILITDSRYTEAAANETSFEILEESGKHRRMDILSECLQKEQIKRVGFEDKHLIYADFVKFKESLTPVEAWIPLGSALERIRQIKAAEEILALRAAEAIGDRAFQNFLNIVKVGMTELEAAAALEYQMKILGAEGLSFETIMASGKHSSMPHAVPTDKKIETGDFLTLDFGCRYHGYCSDMTRTVIFGQPTEEQAKVYDAVLKAQLTGLSVLKPGITGAKADKAARDVISEAGYGDYFGHALGHSVGLFIHEEPRLSPACETVLEPGMIETVEPGIYLPGKFGVRIEDMVLITEDGYENLASSPKELIVL